MPTSWGVKFLQNGGTIEEAKDKFLEAFAGKEKIKGNVALNEGLQELIVV